MMMMDRVARIVVGVGCLCLAGCSGLAGPTKDMRQLRDQAAEALRIGVRYPQMATVRAYAVEAMQQVGTKDMRPWIRQAVHDDNPAVRFAACIALGTLRDSLATDAIAPLASAPVTSDRIAAIFALHRLGDTARTHKLAEYLLNDSDPANRRHAAFVLGRLGERGAIKLLARAMRDDDRGVRTNALESMALLGSPEAVSTLVANCFSGIGAEETLAILALGRLNDPKHRDLFKDRLVKGQYVETQLAAARALGALKDRSGFDLALKSLDYVARKDQPDDPAWNQQHRVREMAALALGAIGDRRALPRLGQVLEHADDPRLQIAAARAILEIQ